MRTRFPAIAVSLLLIAGCDGNSVATTPTSPAAVTLQALTIAGVPSEMVVDDRAQLAAHATYSDGRTADVTGQVRWATLSLACLVDASGLLTAIAAELCQVEATLDGRKAAASLSIGHSNVFSISGTVRERWAPHSPGMRATVTVASGARAGARVVTNADGTFVIAGVPKGTVELTATAAGYETATATVSPARATTELMLESNSDSRDGVFVTDTSSGAPFFQRVTLPFRVTHYGPVTVRLSGYEGNCEISFQSAFWASLTRPDGTSVWSGETCNGETLAHTELVPPGDYIVTISMMNGALPFGSPRYSVSYPR